jgi:REP element-mobilizing transposase RayT
VTSSPKYWHSRGYLPHFDTPRIVQSVTFRLYDSVPLTLVDSWRRDLGWRESLSTDDPTAVELRRRIAKYEDEGHGSCWLAQPEIARLVEDALLHFDGERYRLLAWCVMPNHVHALVEIRERFPLASVVQSWKSFTSKAANALLGRGGKFWMHDYFDRYIRDAHHLARAVAYIEENPVKAGLARAAHEWRWSSARRNAERDRR